MLVRASGNLGALAGVVSAAAQEPRPFASCEVDEIEPLALRDFHPLVSGLDPGNGESRKALGGEPIRSRVRVTKEADDKWRPVIALEIVQALR